MNYHGSTNSMYETASQNDLKTMQNSLKVFGMMFGIFSNSIEYQGLRSPKVMTR